MQGTVQWTDSGITIGGCTLSGDGTYPVNTNNTHPDPLARDALLRLYDDGGGELRYEGYGRRSPDDLQFGETKATCPDPDGGTITIDSFCFHCELWWFTGWEEAVFRLEDDGTALRGTYTMGPDQEGVTSTWTWEFHKVP